MIKTINIGNGSITIHNKGVFSNGLKYPCGYCGKVECYDHNSNFLTELDDMNDMNDMNDADKLETIENGVERKIKNKSIDVLESFISLLLEKGCDVLSNGFEKALTETIEEI
jgi:hypothetical protein